jgi:tetratricopeptide (TPR) repeat protein
MTRQVRLLLSLLSAIVLAVFVVAVSAQNQQPKTPPPTPPDRKAYSDAMTIKEPDKKIEALQQVLSDYPDSLSANAVRQAIFDTLVKSFPDQKARILEQADVIIAKATDAQKPNILGGLGTQLCDAGILLEEAERYATKSLALIEQELAKLKEIPPATPPANTQGNANPRPAPNPAANFERARTTSQLALGRIYLKQGKLDAAEKSLKSALGTNPQLTAATLALAELYDKRGDSENALKSYVTAAATSKMPVASRQALNALYAKSHKGSTAGLEEMLDAKYVELNPPPFEVEPYYPTAARTDRVVLVEVFTGSGCPPCVAADLAADLAMERYSRQELAVIMYHEHIPQPDPMTTPQTTARFKYYAGTGVPTLAIDGATTVGGGARNAAKDVFDRITKGIDRKVNGVETKLEGINKRLEVPSEAKLKLDARLSGNLVKTNVVVDGVTGDSPDLKLYIVLVEEKLRYTGENGVRFHPMVVRSMAGADGTGLGIKSKGPEIFTWDFDLNKISTAIKQHLDEYEASGHRGNTFTFVEKKFAINPTDLSVAAFVQDGKTKAILQTVIIKVKP